MHSILSGADSPGPNGYVVCEYSTKTASYLLVILVGLVAINFYPYLDFGKFSQLGHLDLGIEWCKKVQLGASQSMHLVSQTYIFFLFKINSQKKISM